MNALKFNALRRCFYYLELNLKMLHVVA